MYYKNWEMNTIAARDHKLALRISLVPWDVVTYSPLNQGFQKEVELGSHKSSRTEPCTSCLSQQSSLTTCKSGGSCSCDSNKK